MFATSNFFTALVCGLVSMCGVQRHLLLSTHGSWVLFFMFKTDRRATKVKKTQTLPVGSNCDCVAAALATTDIGLSLNAEL
jgi:hypothetical protein